MSGAAEPELVWPAWLIARAFQDEPPTVLEPESQLLIRLRAAGVTGLLPAEVDPYSGAQLVDEALTGGVRAVGPTLSLRGFIELFPKDAAAPVAAALDSLRDFLERFRTLTRLRLAAQDMKLALLAARDLASRRDGLPSDVDRVLESGLIVTYARAYLASSAGGIGRRWWPKDPADRRLHDRIINSFRHPQHAHTSLGGARRLVRVTRDAEGAPLIHSAFSPNEDFDRIEYLELFGGLDKDDLERIAELADAQRQRLVAAANALADELGETRVPDAGA